MSTRILKASLAAGAAAATVMVALAPASSAAPDSAQAHRRTCWATHYGPIPPGSTTSNGDIFDNSKNTAATSLTRKHQLPFGTRVKVTNVANGKSLVVRINDALYDSAREKIERLAKQSGFEGRLVILAEPEIATGDCRIEWADGGVVLERGAIAAKIDEMVGRYIASRRGS